MTSYGVTTHDGRSTRARAVRLGVSPLDDRTGKPTGTNLVEVVVPLGADFKERLVTARQTAQTIAAVLTITQPEFGVWRCACRHPDHFPVEHGLPPVSHIYLGVRAGADTEFPKVGQVCAWCYDHHQDITQLPVSRSHS